jgi:hypothetical protein
MGFRVSGWGGGKFVLSKAVLNEIWRYILKSCLLEVV